MMYKYILFDLDGTITDPFEGISKSIVYALESFGIKVEDTGELVSFIGPPLFEQFKVYCGFDDKQAEMAVKKYRERYSEIGWKECTLAEGTEELLRELKAAGKVLALATSKPECFAVPILELFGIDKYFDFIGGAELEHNGRNSKEAVIEYVLDKLGITERDEVVIVGDRFHDIDGAKKTGIRSAGVLSGYGSREELEEHGADHIAADMRDVIKFLL